MSAFLRLALLLLFIGGMFLSPVSVSAADLNLHAVVTDVANADTDSSTSQEVFNLLQLQKHQPGDTQANGQGKDGSEFVPLISQRLISFAHHEPVNSKPDYLLAHEFPLPPAPSFTIGYRIDFALTLDWALQADNKNIRLSGWKDSNLLYRFSQTRSIS